MNGILVKEYLVVCVCVCVCVCQLSVKVYRRDRVSKGFVVRGPVRGWGRGCDYQFGLSIFIYYS